MKRCTECQLDISGSLESCPLCGKPLVGTPSDAVFPENEPTRPKKLAQRCLIGLTIAGLLLAVLAGISAGATATAIGAACAAVLVSYIFVRNVIVHSPSFLRTVERYFLVLIALALLLLLATGSTEVATFMIPLLSLVALCTNCVLVILFRNTFVQGYAKYLLYELALGMVPLALLAAGLVTWPALSVAAIIMAGVMLVLMLTLTRKQLAQEVRKLFHV